MSSSKIPCSGSNYSEERKSMVACSDVATSAVRTTKTPSGVLKTTIFWEDKDFPTTAEPFCHDHMVRTVTALTEVLA